MVTLITLLSLNNKFPQNLTSPNETGQTLGMKPNGGKFIGALEQLDSFPKCTSDVAATEYRDEAKP